MHYFDPMSNNYDSGRDFQLAASEYLYLAVYKAKAVATIGIATIFENEAVRSLSKLTGRVPVILRNIASGMSFLIDMEAPRNRRK